MSADAGVKRPSAPKGARSSGRRLWREVVGAYELEEHELALLREAVRTVDLLDQLADIVERHGPMVASPTGMKIHPAAVEARQLKIALARLLAALRMPSGEEGDEAEGRRPQRRVGVRGVYGLRSTA